ncbi:MULTISPECIES: potassium channel family protein [unclassified Tenacibaculum]|uniref:potassium channel family protein n=1 Tax=unclassified Tenacibaculum TaxID=2635139 RepID=UPI001F1E1BA6|nr:MULTISPECIES: potassium channel protein [unclassified Tenacibaculum]MCF2876181.1 ion channel [Tenacibaculum sp. Cn5-1]MCF2936256.1 ion channel [Tenacibaculum sp. Cn5-34]MCG7511599.1 ion channel [Tenacibaculum sp. Cn5-46]
MSTKQKLILFVIIAAIYNLLVYGLYYFESNFENTNIHNLADAYWYSLVTLTTVGYGDFYPITFWGRLIGILFVLGSLGMLGYIVTELSLKISEYLKKREMGYFGTDMNNHCIIIGWNTFSKQVAEQIINAGEDLAIVVNQESDLKTIKQIYSDKNCFVLLADLNDFKALEKINITNSRRVYISFENDTDSLVYTISLKKRFEKVNCVVAIENIELKSSFNYLGVQFIIPKKEIVSKFIASYIFEPNVALLTEDLISTSNDKSNLDICETKLTANHNYTNTRFLDTYIDLKEKSGITLVALSRDEQLIKNPENNLILKENDVLVYIANGENKLYLN